MPSLLPIGLSVRWLGWFAKMCWGVGGTIVLWETRVPGWFLWNLVGLSVGADTDVPKVAAPVRNLIAASMIVLRVESTSCRDFGQHYLQAAERLGGNRACLSVACKLLKRSYHTLRGLGQEALQPA